MSDRGLELAFAKTEIVLLTKKRIPRLLPVQIGDVIAGTKARIVVPSDGFVRFQQLIINNIDLATPNTQHNLRSLNIRPSRRRRSMTGQFL